MRQCLRRGPQQSASPAERLIRLLGTALVGLALAGCSASYGSPAPPRPVVSLASTTTTSTLPTTTVVAEELTTGSEDCLTAFCLRYHISPRATWSSGDPVTARDFAHTVSLLQDPNLADSPGGYDLIETVEVVDDKTLMLGLSQPYGAWQGLFNRVYHEDEPADDLVGLSTSGPFKFVEWTEGDHVTVARDPEWWADIDPIGGGSPGDVEEVTFVFIDTLDEMLEALEDGVVDVISARPDIATVEALGEMEEVGFTVSPGSFWEHIDFHHEDQMLAQRWVREVFSMAIDRQKILDRTVRLLDPTAVALDNTVFMADTANYEPHFDDTFDPARAEDLLVEYGCARGDDGIYVCTGNRMSFSWASTNDDPARAEIFESAREDLEVVGIEIVADLKSPSEFVTREFLFGGPDAWQLINFSWRARPDPRDANATYYCDDAGDLNVNRYCSEEVERLIRDTEQVVDPLERIDVYNRADQRYLEELALIPLYQKPVLMAWRADLSGPQPNYSPSSDTWNVATWSGKESVVMALPAEPTQIDPRSWGDESANVIMGSLLYGAFGMNPSLEAVPVLVDSVDVLEGQP